MLDLNENYNMVPNTNHRPVNKLLNSNSIDNKNNVASNGKGHELSRDKSEIMVDLAP